MRTTLLGFLMLAAAPLGAQRATLTAPVDVLHAPNGRPIATMKAGTSPNTGATRSGFVQVSLQGYVPQSALGGARDSFALTVKDASVEMRSGPQSSAPALATLRQGMGLVQIRRNGDWVLVRRAGWIPERLAGTPTVAAASATPREQPPAGVQLPDSSDLIAPSGGALRDSPGGRVIATLGDSARLQALYRERGWVRVRVDAWVRDQDVTESDTALRAALMPADLRADPAGTRGRMVRWDVQKLAMQTADALQRDMAENEPYMLARGPGADHPLLYLAVPPSLLAGARNVPALSFVTVIARVRSGKSAPGGVPILDVVSLVAR